MRIRNYVAAIMIVGVGSLMVMTASIAKEIAVQFKALAPYCAEFSLTLSGAALQLRLSLMRE